MFSYLRIIFSFLNQKDRRFLMFLVCAMVLTALVELVSVGALFPYIKILGDQKIIHTSHFLSYIYSTFHFKSDSNFLIFAGSAIFLMILMKGGMTTCNNYFQTRFTSGLDVRLSRFCFKSYLSMPYADVLSKNSSVLSKHLLVDVMYAVLVLSGVLTIATDIIVSLALLSLMLFVDFKLIVSVMLILCCFLFLTLKWTRGAIRQLGKQDELYNQKMFKVSSSALQGFKDVKVHGVEQYFMSHYMSWRSKYAKNFVTYNVISNIPSSVMNIMGFGLLLAILLYLMASHGNLVAVLPVVGLIAICIQRMMPAASRISVQLGIIRRYESSVRIVRKAVDFLQSYDKNKLFSKKQHKPVIFNHQLVLNNVAYSYPDSDKAALKNISINIKKGSALGIVGPSGAGKSTLVDVLLGLLPVQSGDILCDDLNISHQGYAHLCNLVGYVPQQTHLLDGTIKENIAFGVEEEAVSDAAIERAIHIAQLESLITSLPDGLNTMIGEKGVRLSGGQRQRLGIARALYSDPEIIIMDEATNALDSVTENEFSEALKLLMGKKTLIIIAHRFTSVQFCDKLLILDQGEIVSRGTHDYLSKTSSLYRELYAIDY